MNLGGWGHDHDGTVGGMVILPVTISGVKRHIKAVGGMIMMTPVLILDVKKHIKAVGSMIVMTPASISGVRAVVGMLITCLHFRCQDAHQGDYKLVA